MGSQLHSVLPLTLPCAAAHPRNQTWKSQSHQRSPICFIEAADGSWYQAGRPTILLQFQEASSPVTRGREALMRTHREFAWVHTACQKHTFKVSWGWGELSRKQKGLVQGIMELGQSLQSSGDGHTFVVTASFANIRKNDHWAICQTSVFVLTWLISWAGMLAKQANTPLSSTSISYECRLCLNCSTSYPAP